MNVYLVSYDLNKTGQNYSALYKELEASSAWSHPLDSTWLIATNESADQLSTRMRKHLDSNDLSLVIKVTNSYAGWLTEEMWNWIYKHI